MEQAKGEQSAPAHRGRLKNADMAKEAAPLLDGIGWLPESLRV